MVGDLAGEEIDDRLRVKHDALVFEGVVQPLRPDQTVGQAAALRTLVLVVHRAVSARSLASYIATSAATIASSTALIRGSISVTPADNVM